MVRLTLALIGLLVVGSAIPALAGEYEVGNRATMAEPSAVELEVVKKATVRDSATAVVEVLQKEPAQQEPLQKAAVKKEPAKKETKDKGAIEIEWYGQACFLFKCPSGVTIVVDPFDDEKMPYTLPEGPVTLAFASHDHADHNNVSGVSPQVAVKGGEGGAMVTEPLKTIPPYGTYTFTVDSTSYVLTVVPSFHDDEKGDKRGHNIISVWDIDGIRIAHLGDLGCDLEKKQVDAIGELDVLLIPVGGYYTIDAKQARAIVEQLSPRIVVPMHFSTKALGTRLPISGVDEFLKGWKSLTKAEGSVLRVTPWEPSEKASDKAPKEPEIVLLKYHGQES